MKKKILEILMWGICIVALAVMSTVVVREYQKSQNTPLLSAAKHL